MKQLKQIAKVARCTEADVLRHGDNCEDDTCDICDAIWRVTQ